MPHPGLSSSSKLLELERIAGLRSRDIADGILELCADRTQLVARAVAQDAELAALRAHLQELNASHDRLLELRASAVKLARIATKLGPSPAEAALIRARAQELLDLDGEP